MPMQWAFSQQLTPVWVPATVAGNGTQGNTGDGGPAISAEITTQFQMAVDKAGNLYLSDPTNHVIRKVDVNGIISTVVGTTGKKGYSGDNGPATAALLNTPYGVAFDNNGNLLIADRNNYAIRKVDAVTGIITTVAGSGTLGSTGDNGPATSATLNGAYTVACDRYGNIYIPDYSANLVRKVDTTGTITTIAGTGKSGYTGDNGPATSATLHGPYGAFLDLSGNLYFSDYGNNAIRVIDLSGNIHTVAGGGKPPTGNGDGGPATSASLNEPRPLTGDNSGNLYIPDEHNQSVRWVSASGIINTIAGNGKEGGSGDGGPGTDAELLDPYGLAMDSSNNIYVADIGNFRIRRLSFNAGLPSTAVGATSVTQNFIVQSTAAVTLNTATVTPAKPAEFTLGALSGCTLGTSLAANTPCIIPVTLAPTAPGLQMAQLAITDMSGVVSAFGFTGVGIAPETTFSLAAISTIAGTGTAGNTGADGPAASAQLSAPRGGVIDSAGNVYFADSGNNVVRRIDAVTGVISTVAGSGASGYAGDGAAATAAQLNAPAKVAVDAAGDLYIADTGNNAIRFVNAANGMISTIAGTGTASYTGDQGLATSATLNHPQGLAVDLAGGVYVADTGNNTIRYFGKNGVIVTLTGAETAGYSGDGGNALNAALNAPETIALDQAGDVYIADTGNDVVRMISATNQISTVAGQQGSASNTGDGGAATAATLLNPSDIALDAAGDLYIAAGGQVRMVNMAGIISTLAGTGATGGYSGEGGAATSAVLPSPVRNLMLDSTGDIVLGDTAANRLLKVSSATPMSLNMGTVAAGTTGTPQTFSVLNAGNSTLNFSGLAATAGFILQTGAASACTSTTSLASGQTCSISIVFSPPSSANGAVSGTLTLTDNALNGTGVTQTFALSGSTKLIYSTATSISASPASPVYGGSATITATVSNGSSPTGTVSFTVNGTSIGNASLNDNQVTIALPKLSAGPAQIAANYAGDANNNSSTGTATVTIQPAVLTVTAMNATMAQGSSAPAFTYIITGFVNGDTSSVVTGAPAETTTATSSSPQGTYPITPTQGTLAALNYTFSFVNGTLTVQPPPSPDFTLSVTPASTSVTAGQTGLVTLTLAPLYGYKGTVKISCTSTPQSVRCSPTGPLTSDGQDPAYTQLSIFTSGQNVATGRNNPPGGAPRVWVAMGMPLCFLGLTLYGGRRRWTGRLLSLLLLAALTAGMSACSQGSGGATAATGTYQVVATAADTSANVSHTATFTLTIQ
ncbi:MAG: MBG domain-containing protein [Edaphobacter sp.]